MISVLGEYKRRIIKRTIDSRKNTIRIEDPHRDVPARDEVDFIFSIRWGCND